MRDDTQHPARSVEFLSRLHDGELSPAERARFESHRAHCSECRRSAMEFEESLSLFRSARSRPPNADLAARILRKVQAGPRRPSPFGVVFGIDPRWAAAAATVVFGLLLGYAVLERGRPSSRIPVSFVTPSPDDASGQASVARAPAGEPEPPSSVAGSPPRDSRKPRPDSEPPAPSERREANPKTAAPVHAEEAAPPPVVVSAEAPLVDSGRAAAARPPLPPAARAPRMVIEAIDGHGAPPSLLSESPLEIPPGERGLRYVLLVDSRGTVTEVSPEARRSETLETREAPAAGAPTVGAANATPAALSTLRFEPGNRPRRLLVRFE